MKKTNIFGLVLILSTLLIGCAQPNMCADIPEVYTITKNSPEHGTVELSKTSAMAGETITVTATPVEHYQVSEIKVNDNRITGTSFTMPASNVNVEVNFAQIRYSITSNDGYTFKNASGQSITTAAYGETVYVTSNPGEVYEVALPKFNRTNVEIATNTTYGDYKFVMPSSDVIVTGTFVSGNDPRNFFINDSPISMLESFYANASDVSIASFFGFQRKYRELIIFTVFLDSSSDTYVPDETATTEYSVIVIRFVNGIVNIYLSDN